MPLEVIKCPSCGRQLVSELDHGKHFIPHHRTGTDRIGPTCEESGMWARLEYKKGKVKNGKA